MSTHAATARDAMIFDVRTQTRDVMAISETIAAHKNLAIHHGVGTMMGVVLVEDAEIGVSLIATRHAVARVGPMDAKNRDLVVMIVASRIAQLAMRVMDMLAGTTDASSDNAQANGGATTSVVARIGDRNHTVALDMVRSRTVDVMIAPTTVIVG